MQLKCCLTTAEEEERKWLKEEKLFIGRPSIQLYKSADLERDLIHEISLTRLDDKQIHPQDENVTKSWVCVKHKNSYGANVIATIEIKI